MNENTNFNADVENEEKKEINAKGKITISKVREGWKKGYYDTTYAQRVFYLKKGKYRVITSIYTGKKISPQDLNTKFLAIKNYEEKEPGTMKIVDRILNAKSVSDMETKNKYEDYVLFIVHAFLIEGKDICEL